MSDTIDERIDVNIDNNLEIFDNQSKMEFDGKKVQNKYYIMELKQ